MQSNRIHGGAAVFVALLANGARVAGAQAPSNPCSPVSTAQVTNALGEAVADGKQQNAKTCAWVADVPKHEIVSLMFSPPGDWDTRKTRQMVGVTKTPVSGIGDDAFFETAANFGTLYVKKGSVTFMVRVYGVPDLARQLAIEKPIAQTVASKI